MFILGSICCRGGSKGVPGKNIRMLGGKPLLVHTIDAAKKSHVLDALTISTDSQDIADIAIKNGIEVPSLRPAYLADDIANKWDVFKHIVYSFECETGNHVDYLADFDVTVPLKSSSDIDGAINYAIATPNAEVVITGYEPERNPYFNMMEISDDGSAILVKKSSTPIVRRQDAPAVFSLTPAAFVIKRETLFKYNHWSEAKCFIYEMPRERAIDIDTEFDFKLIENLIKLNGRDE